MDKKDEEFLKRLLSIFKIEAQEHLSTISSGLIELEKSDPNRHTVIVETVFREAHSLKGAARSVNLADVVSVCQSMEDVFSALKRNEIVSSAQVLDLLHEALDFAAKLVGEKSLSASEESELKELIRRLEEATEKKLNGEAAKVRNLENVEGEEDESVPVHRLAESPVQEAVRSAPSPAVMPAPGLAMSETVRISTAKLDALLLQAEEMLSVKLATQQRAAELKELKKTFDLWKKEKGKSGVRTPDGITPGQGWKFGVQQTPDNGSPTTGLRADALSRTMESKLAVVMKACEYDQRSVGTMVDNLLDDMKMALMLPISSLLEIFPRFVRDLSRDAGKKIKLTIDGGEIEIDRRVLEEMKAPLVHLVRNCVDHAIEVPDEREKKGKPVQGNIRISVFSRGSKIEIAVSDDGAGIDIPKSRIAAVKQGIVSQDEADRLTGQEALQLVFRSGVSTSPIITDISGRGLGLAIVREKVEKLNGTVAIDTEPDRGTTFRLVLPLTLATFRGVLVRVGEHRFIIPSTNVERVAKVRKDGIQTVENRETLSFNGQAISLVRLGDILEISRQGSGIRDQTNLPIPDPRPPIPALRSAGRGLPNPGPRPLIPDLFCHVVVLGAAEKRMAFLTDEILQEQEVLVKPLGRQLSRVRNIAGATLLGSGKVVPILNVSDLIKSAVKTASAPTKTFDKEVTKRQSVLVVEDSITARTLLKNILESAGYNVMTAVDGADALATLKTREFDLVVSDIDMPRMNGLQLTSKIRKDKKLLELPVVLVTALESREDRERGIDAGANAYIVKSSFDQSNLLEVIKRLI